MHEDSAVGVVDSAPLQALGKIDTIKINLSRHFETAKPSQGGEQIHVSR